MDNIYLPTLYLEGLQLFLEQSHPKQERETDCSPIIDRAVLFAKFLKTGTLHKAPCHSTKSLSATF